MKQAFPIILIYLGTMMYTLAAYYHLKLNRKEWNFTRVFIMAMPLVAIEYTFSLHGNYYAHEWLGMTPMQILILTMCFYFVNLWLLNHYILKHKTHFIREVIAMVLILSAFIFANVH